MKQILPTATQIADAIAHYSENAYGFNGPLDYAATQYPRHDATFQAALAAAIA